MKVPMRTRGVVAAWVIAASLAVGMGAPAQAAITNGIYKGRLRVVRTVGRCGHRHHIWNKFSVKQVSRRKLRIREAGTGHYRMRLVKHGRWYRGHRNGAVDREIWMRYLSSRSAFRFVGINSWRDCDLFKLAG